MTYQEFLIKLYSTHDIKTQRTGQYLMNLLHEVWEPQATKITAESNMGKSKNDCFYNDNLVPNTLEYLAKVWPK